MTIIGLIGLTILACQSNKDGYTIKGNIEGAGNGTAIMTIPVGREEVTTGDTVKMKDGNFTFTGKLEEPTMIVIQICPDKEKTASFSFIGEITRSLSLENGQMLSTNTGIGVYRMLM